MRPPTTVARMRRWRCRRLRPVASGQPASLGRRRPGPAGWSPLRSWAWRSLFSRIWSGWGSARIRSPWIACSRSRRPTRMPRWRPPIRPAGRRQGSSPSATGSFHRARTARLRARARRRSRIVSFPRCSLPSTEWVGAEVGAEVDDLTDPGIEVAPTPAPLAAEPEAPATGWLLVRTDPAGALVVVDGVERGVTPLSVEDVAFGEHRVEIVREGFGVFTDRVVVDRPVTPVGVPPGARGRGPPPSSQRARPPGR